MCFFACAFRVRSQGLQDRPRPSWRARFCTYGLWGLCWPPPPYPHQIDLYMKAHTATVIAWPRAQDDFKSSVHRGRCQVGACTYGFATVNSNSSDMLLLLLFCILGFPAQYLCVFLLLFLQQHQTCALSGNAVVTTHSRYWG